MNTTLNKYGLENTLNEVRDLLDEACATSNPFKKNELIHKALGMLECTRMLLNFNDDI